MEHFKIDLVKSGKAHINQKIPSENNWVIRRII